MKGNLSYSAPLPISRKLGEPLGLPESQMWWLPKDIESDTCQKHLPYRQKLGLQTSWPLVFPTASLGGKDKLGVAILPGSEWDVMPELVKYHLLLCSCLR